MIEKDGDHRDKEEGREKCIHALVYSKGIKHLLMGHRELRESLLMVINHF